MQRTLDANISWYKRRFAKNYDTILAARSTLKEKFDQFPDAFCVDASRLLLSLLPNLSVVCGRFQNKKMERSFLHVWVFDMEGGCHIDITADQFSPFKQNIVIFKTSDTDFMKKFGYSVTPLETFNELFRGPLRRFTMSKYRIHKTPLRTLVTTVKRKIRK